MTTQFYRAVCLALLAIVLVGCHGDERPQVAGDPSDASAVQARVAVPDDGLYAIEVNRIQGDPVSLDAYRGQVLLIVNTASRCGRTPQYADLQKLHEAYGDQGLAVLAFPANNFANQEPGSNEEIAAFCEARFGVRFDLFERISVKGDDQHPLYALLTGESFSGDSAGPVQWNFEKFLISRDGRLLARFGSAVAPSSPQVVEQIQAALAG